MCKKRVKLSLCLTKHYAMKTYGEWIYRVFQKKLYNGIPNVTVWRVIRKRFT
jgi:hypothetical protein